VRDGLLLFTGKFVVPCLLLFTGKFLVLDLFSDTKLIIQIADPQTFGGGQNGCNLFLHISAQNADLMILCQFNNDI